MKLKLNDLFKVNKEHPEYNRHKEAIYRVARTPFNATWDYQNEYGELFLDIEVDTI